MLAFSFVTAKECQRRADEAKIKAPRTNDPWERDTLLHIATLWQLVASHRASEEAKQTHYARVMYGIFDIMLHRLVLTARNSPTKEAAKDDLLHYPSADHSQEELTELSKLTLDELAARCHCQLLRHSNPYPD